MNGNHNNEIRNSTQSNKDVSASAQSEESNTTINNNNNNNCNSMTALVTSSTETNDSFTESFLIAHNRYRKLHGAPNLQLSKELCAKAQEWANKISRKRHMSYSELAGLGECITFFPLHLTAEEIVEYWYEEHRKYEYETPGWQVGTNYFTQIVWYSTQEIGIGRAIVQRSMDPSNRRFMSRSTCSSNGSIAQSPTIEEQVVVAFYRPAGNNNRAGQFALNVYKPIKSKSKL